MEGDARTRFRGPYRAEVERLIAVTPKGFLVLFFRESGIFDDKRQFSAKDTTSTTILFPFNVMTKVTIFGDTEVIGVFTNRIETTGQLEAGGEYRKP